jgi:hypothetical protein
MFPESVESLNETFNLAEWRVNIDLRIANLTDRVSSLEENNMRITRNEATHRPSLQAKLKRELHSSFTYADNLGFGYLNTVSKVVKLNLFAKLQLLFLIFCIVSFILHEAQTFQDAKTNEESHFKPEKILYVKDYSINSTKEESLYEIPYIWIQWFAIFNDTDERLNYTDATQLLPKLLQSQDRFKDSVQIKYEWEDAGVVPGFTSTVHNLSFGSYGIGFWFSFKLKVTDLLSNGKLKIAIFLDIDALTLQGTVIPEHLLVIPSREDTGGQTPQDFPSVLDFKPVKDDDNEVEVFIIEWSESIHRKYNSDHEYSSFESAVSKNSASIDFLRHNYNILIKDTQILIMILPDMKVEHWEEYVPFGYSNWLAEMGGFFSLITTGFLWIAYYIATFFGDGILMGILPALSFSFFNFEGLQWIKSRSRILEML